MIEQAWKPKSIEEKRANRQARKRRYEARFPEKANAAKLKYKRLHPEINRAHQAVYKAVKFGQLYRQPCEVCGNRKSQAHHDDYDNRLDVRWLCHIHHHQIHNAVI